MKKVIGVYSAPRGHWVGDGFPVRSLFSYDTTGKALSPFLLLDRAGPTEFPPTTERRGVGEHPHRGFETVTIVYKGEVAHKDSAGNGGVIGPGDVQWMTAAAGVVHEEFHTEAFSRAGGMLDMVQLWVNLPAKDKMSQPGYQGILDKDIPSVSLSDGGGSVRVIAGEFNGHTGPARTHSPLSVLDLRLASGAMLNVPVTEGWTAAVVVLSGAVQVNGGTHARDADLVILEQRGQDLAIAATGDAHVLVLLGEPLDEPIAGSGPFVMNTQEEIAQAFADFRRGEFGQITH